MHSRQMKPRQRSTARGAVAFETVVVMMAITLPLIFGIMDFSRAMYAYHFVAYAAREGSRWASVRGATCTSPMVDCGAAASTCSPSSACVQGFVQSFIPPGMFVTSCNGTNAGSLCAVVLTATGKEADGATDCTNGGTFPTDYPGCVVQVQVTYYYGFTFPFFSNLGPLAMSSTSQMTITQ